MGFYQSFHSRVIAAASTAITRPQKKRLALATEKQELKMPHSMSVKAVNIDIDPRCHLRGTNERRTRERVFDGGKI